MRLRQGKPQVIRLIQATIPDQVNIPDRRLIPNLLNLTSPLSLLATLSLHHLLNIPHTLHKLPRIHLGTITRRLILRGMQPRVMGPRPMRICLRGRITGLITRINHSIPRYRRIQQLTTHIHLPSRRECRLGHPQDLQGRLHQSSARLGMGRNDHVTRSPRLHVLKITRERTTHLQSMPRSLMGQLLSHHSALPQGPCRPRKGSLMASHQNLLLLVGTGQILDVITEIKRSKTIRKEAVITDLRINRAIGGHRSTSNNGITVGTALRDRTCLSLLRHEQDNLNMTPTVTTIATNKLLPSPSIQHTVARLEMSWIQSWLLSSKTTTPPRKPQRKS